MSRRGDELDGLEVAVRTGLARVATDVGRVTQDAIRVADAWSPEVMAEYAASRAISHLRSTLRGLPAQLRHLLRRAESADATEGSTAPMPTSTSAGSEDF